MRVEGGFDCRFFLYSVYFLECSFFFSVVLGVALFVIGWLLDLRAVRRL